MGGSPWICSGAVATDVRSGVSLVLTAAHCAYDNARLAFATNWMFIPEFDANPTYSCSSTKWGCWTASALVVHNGYASAGGFTWDATLHDYAFAVVHAGGHRGTQLDATVGKLAIAFGGVNAGQTMSAFGYPAGAPYDGRDLTYCSGPVSGDPNTLGRTWGMGCTMTGGSSGGPWLSGFKASNGTGTLGSVNSYTYSGVAKMHGPKFNSSTQSVYSAANAATTNTIVP
jgi:V8-like Glu-specific endopeptidase